MDDANSESRRILDGFHSELEQTMAGGGPEDVLRWTGQQLAEAGERLRKAPADRRSARAAELLVIAHPHIAALSEAGMKADALATATMALLTVLHARVNPEDFHGLYLQCLQQLCISAAEYIYDAPGDAAMAASQIAAQCFGLFIATERAYAPCFGASPAMRRFADHIRNTARDAGEQLTHFQGHRIEPTLAIDILTDNAARLAALGVIN